MKKLKLKNEYYEQLQASFQSWLEALNYSTSTSYSLPNFVREFLHYQEGKNKNIEHWQQEDFKDFMNYVQNRKNQRRAGALSSNHLNKIVQALCLLQSYLGKLGKLDFYYKIERLQQESREISILNQQEIKQLYEVCDESAFGYRNRVMLGLCYGCGLRKSEAIALDISDFWWEKSLLQVRKSKTKVSRLVPITERLMLDFKEYENLVRPLFLGQGKSQAFLLNYQGERLSKQSLYLSFVTLLKVAEMPKMGLHVLRHSIASHLAQSGMSSEQIGQFLGHKTLDSTQIYVHLKSKVK